MPTVIEDRLAKLEDLTLDTGSHTSIEDGACLMEVTSWLIGDEFTDHHPCVSPIIGAFLRRWQDDLGDEDRQTLKPYAVTIIGTASTPEVEDRRAWMVTDWMVRSYLPTWLRLGGMADQADAVAGLPELVDRQSWEGGAFVVREAQTKAVAAWVAARAAAGVAARAAAGVAARDAAGVAARDAAWDAARVAAGAAAWDAARVAAWDAARVAAGAAAGVAARDAAGVAARDALRPTVVGLQESARDLLDRLIAVTADDQVLAVQA